MTARFYKLTELHQKLDSALRREINRRAPEQFRVMALKRRKLRVKDLLTRLTRQPVRAKGGWGVGPPLHSPCALPAFRFFPRVPS